MDKPVIRLENITKKFPVRRTLLQVLQRQRFWVTAVDGISLSIRDGETLALVGESGCGKTTTGKIIMKLLAPTGGKLFFKEEDVTGLDMERMKNYRRQVQMIFQDPYASMNPRFRVRDVLEEPLLIHSKGKNHAYRELIITDALDAVRLIPAHEFLSRFPHMMSGGQRQRVTTARSLVLKPSVIVADEPVSMIDLSTRAEILHMLRTVQKTYGLTYIYITHDLSTARYFADRIAVMYLGKIMELGDSDDVITNPQHPYTKALIASVCEPVAGNVDTIKKIPVTGEIPHAANIPKGCRFHPRCIYAKPACSETEPEEKSLSFDHFASCHLL